MAGAQGHITVRRAPRDGNDGADGKDGISLLITGNPMTFNTAEFSSTASWSKNATVSVYQGGDKLTVTGMSSQNANFVISTSVDGGNGVLTFSVNSSTVGLGLLIAAVLANSGISFTVTFTDKSGTSRSLDGSISISVVANGEQGEQGIDGCIVRVSEWVEGVEYRNDESLTSGTRFLDIAVVSGSSPNDFSAYKCLQTHTASSSNKPPTSGNNSYWQKFNNMAPIYTPLIMASNAVIRFAQTNQLLVMKKEDATKVAAGMGGGDYPLWAGAETPSEAPFRVSYEGNLHAENAEISGIIHSSLTYSSVKRIVDLSTYTIDPAKDAFNTLFIVSTRGTWVYLPDANTYNGLELNIYQSAISMIALTNVYITTANSSQKIYCSTSTAYINETVVQTIVQGIPMIGSSFKLIPNVLIRIIAVEGNWYVLSGALTGE